MSPEDREQALQQMQKVSHHFYREAIQVGNHPFVEFCGFMNEYIKLAANAHEQDIDFSEATEHNGRPLPIANYNAEYIAEKFACIFGPTFRANPDAWKVFCQKVMHNKAGV